MWPGCRPVSRIEFQVFLTANWITPLDIKVKPKSHHDSTAKAVLVWRVDICVTFGFQMLNIFALAMQIQYMNVNKQLGMQAVSEASWDEGILNSCSFTDVFLLESVSLSICRILLRSLNTNRNLLRTVSSAQSIPLDTTMVHLLIFTIQCLNAAYIEIYFSAYRDYFIIWHLTLCLSSIFPWQGINFLLYFFALFED